MFYDSALIAYWLWSSLSTLISANAGILLPSSRTDPYQFSLINIVQALVFWSDVSNNQLLCNLHLQQFLGAAILIASIPLGSFLVWSNETKGKQASLRAKFSPLLYKVRNFVQIAENIKQGRYLLYIYKSLNGDKSWKLLEGGKRLYEEADPFRTISKSCWCSGFVKHVFAHAVWHSPCVSNKNCNPLLHSHPT